MDTLIREHMLTRDVAMPEHVGSLDIASVCLEPLDEPVLLVVVPPLLPRCPRWRHRMLDGATDCLACRALGLWPRLDRRKLARAAPDLDRIARLAERTTSLDVVTIKGMLTRQRDR